MNPSAISLLQNRIQEIERLLSGALNSTSLVEEKKNLVEAVETLEFFQKHNLNRKMKVLTIPSLVGHGYANYRLMIDNEREDVKHWSRVDQIDGEPALFSAGDKILF